MPENLDQLVALRIEALRLNVLDELQREDGTYYRKVCDIPVQDLRSFVERKKLDAKKLEEERQKAVADKARAEAEEAARRQLVRAQKALARAARDQQTAAPPVTGMAAAFAQARRAA